MKKASRSLTFTTLILIVASIIGYQISESQNQKVAAKSRTVLCEESTESPEVRIKMDCQDGNSKNKKLEVHNKSFRTKKISYETQESNPLSNNKKQVDVVLPKKEKKVISLPEDTQEVNVKVEEVDEPN